MSKAKSYNFPDHKSGDTFAGVQFEILVNTVAANLVGSTINMEINGTLTYSTSTGELVLSDPSNGKFQFAEQIIDLVPGNYYYEITITFADLSVKTYIEGYWRIIE